MLSKKICKRCINKRFPRISPWMDDDEEDWEAGLVDCAAAAMQVEVENNPPDDCFYFVEQFLYHNSIEETDAE